MPVSIPKFWKLIPAPIQKFSQINLSLRFFSNSIPVPIINFSEFNPDSKLFKRQSHSKPQNFQKSIPEFSKFDPNPKSGIIQNYRKSISIPIPISGTGIPVSTPVWSYAEPVACRKFICRFPKPDRITRIRIESIWSKNVKMIIRLIFIRSAWDWKQFLLFGYWIQQIRLMFGKWLKKKFSLTDAYHAA